MKNEILITLRFLICIVLGLFVFALYQIGVEPLIGNGSELYKIGEWFIVCAVWVGWVFISVFIVSGRKIS